MCDFKTPFSEVRQSGLLSGDWMMLEEAVTSGKFKGDPFEVRFSSNVDWMMLEKQSREEDLSVIYQT